MRDLRGGLVGFRQGCRALGGLVGFRQGCRALGGLVGFRQEWRAGGTSNALSARGMGGIVGTVLLLLAAGAGPATAHAALLGTDPKDGSTLRTAPRELTIEFSEAIGRPAVIVTGPDGRRVSGEPSSLDRTVTVPLRGADERGEYRMAYRVVSVDGHPVSGESTFTTTTGAEPTRTVSAPAPDERSFVHRHAEHIVWIALAAVLGIALIVAPLVRRRRTP